MFALTRYPPSFGQFQYGRFEYERPQYMRLDGHNKGLHHRRRCVVADGQTVSQRVARLTKHQSGTLFSFLLCNREICIFLYTFVLLSSKLSFKGLYIYTLIKQVRSC